MHISAYLADQNPHRDRSFGISRYTRTLLSGLVNAGVSITTLVSTSSLRFAGATRELRVPVPTDRAPLRFACDQLTGLLPALPAEGEGVRLFPKGFLPWAQATPIGRSPLALPVVHDVILQHYADRYPRYMGALNLRYFLFGLLRTLKTATMVVTDSASAQGQIEAFCDRHGLRRPPVTVIPLASELEVEVGPAPRAVAKGDDVLHLSSPAPHKGTLRLLQMWQTLQARGEVLPGLRLVGRLPARADSILSGLAGVRHGPMLSDAELVEVMRGARALLMPSELEGFGLPVLEAHYLQTPACYGQGTAMEEYMRPVSVAGCYPLGDVDGFYGALQAVLSESPEDLWATATALKGRLSVKQLATRMRDLLSTL